MRGEVGERRECASLLSDAVAQLARARYPSLCVRTLSPTDLAPLPHRPRPRRTAAVLSASHDASFAVRSLSLPLLSDVVAQLARARYPSLCVRTLSPIDLAHAATAAALSASHDASFAVRSLSLPANPAVAPHSTTVPPSSPMPPPSWPAPRPISGASAPTGFGGNWTTPRLGPAPFHVYVVLGLVGNVTSKIDSRF